MNLARGLGFPGGALARVALVGLYAALAAGAIVVVESRPPRPPPTAALVPDEARDRVDVQIEATYPVAAWTVRYAGAAVTADEAGPSRWRGRLAVDPGERQLVVEAAPSDPLASGPCALRIAVRRAGGATESSTLWGSGFISGIVVLPGGARP